MKRFALAVLTAVGLVLVSGGAAQAQTAHQDWLSCRSAAASEANSCYMASSGYWGDVSCGFWWSANDLACDNALAKKLTPD